MRALALSLAVVALLTCQPTPGTVHVPAQAGRVRTLTDAQAKVWASGHINTPFRLLVQDVGGTWRDLSSLAGKDWIVSATIVGDVDAPVDTLEVVLKREVFYDSLSPLRSDSRLNRVGGEFAALLRPSAPLIAETAVIPVGAVPTEDDWIELWRGEVDTFNLAKGLRLRARGVGFELQDNWLKRDHDYGSDSGVDIEDVFQQMIKDGFADPFQASHAYSAAHDDVHGDRVTPTTHNGFWYRVTASTGTFLSGAEPSWPTTIGGTVASGDVTFTCAGRVPTLYVPVSPSFAISPEYTQKPISPMEAIRSMALSLLGWEVRPRWREATGQFEITLRDPDRERVDVDFEFTPDQYHNIEDFTVDRSTVRNEIEVIFPNSESLGPDGKPLKTAVSRQSKESMDLYSGGLPLWMQIVEEATGQLNTTTEAETVADAALSDTKDPKAVAEYRMHLFPWVQLNDRVTFKADGVLYDADQTFAVTGYRHEFMGAAGGGQVRTFLQVRGKPVAGVKQWLTMQAGDVVPARFQGPNAPSDITVEQVAGGFLVRFDTPPRWASTELHLSTDDDFTPDDATFRGKSSSNFITVSNLTYGATYYGRLIAKDKHGNASEPSEEFTFIAGFVNPRALNPNYTGELPVNGSFEVVSFGAAAPPDAWEVLGGTTWVEDPEGEVFDKAFLVDLAGTGESFYGTKCVGFLGDAPRLASRLFPMGAGEKLDIDAYLENGGVLDAAYLAIQWFDDDGALIDAYEPSSTSWFIDDDVGNRLTTTPSPVGTVMARVVIGADDPSQNLNWMGVRVSRRDGTEWHFVGETGEPAFQNSWVNQFTGAPSYSRFAFRRVGRELQIKGGISKGGSAPTDPNAVVVFPSGFRPAEQRFVTVYGEGPGGGPTTFRLKTDGTLEWRSGNYSSFVTFDQVAVLLD